MDFVEEQVTVSNAVNNLPFIIIGVSFAALAIAVIVVVCCIVGHRVRQNRRQPLIPTTEPKPPPGYGAIDNYPGQPPTPSSEMSQSESLHQDIEENNAQSITPKSNRGYINSTNDVSSTLMPSTPVALSPGINQKEVMYKDDDAGGTTSAASSAPPVTMISQPSTESHDIGCSPPTMIGVQAQDGAEDETKIKARPIKSYDNSKDAINDSDAMAKSRLRPAII